MTEQGGEKRVLIVEDDPDIASALARGLLRDGYRTEVAADASAALDLAQQGVFTAAVVDMMLGEERGDDLVRALRARGLSAPIIILSALSGVEDRTRGLEAGADDYVAKPFDFAELLVRLKVQEKRREEAMSGRLAFGGLIYDESLRRITAGDRQVELTEREGDLMRFLLKNAGRVVNRSEIFDSLWAIEGNSSENVVDVYLGYLRRKLSPASDFGVVIRTLRGRGFILTENRDA